MSKNSKINLSKQHNNVTNNNYSTMCVKLFKTYKKTGKINFVYVPFLINNRAENLPRPLGYLYIYS